MKQPPEPSEILNEGDDAFSFPSQLSDQMRKLILWMMTPNLRRRPQSVAEVQMFLDKESAGSNPVDTDGEDTETTILPEEKLKGKPTPPFVKGAWTNNRKAIASCIAAVFVVVLAVVLWPDKEIATTISDLPSASSETFTANGVSFKMIRVEGGSFTMGATSEQGSDADSDESPIHRVTLSTYYIGETEVTQALWEAVMGNNPSHFKGSNLPVEQVSWEDCQNFIRELNRITGKSFRLPTEAEWEYAARGGNKSQSCKYSGSNALDKVAWYEDNSGSKTHEVRSKSPNELGIYDMSGNVWEWCQDWYGSYGSYAQTNPAGSSSGSYRVYRGGSWHNAGYCRVSLRSYNTPDFQGSRLGLRLAL